jgi:phosphatidylserine/phosphatidylglycerophosphate/cardiolipin synthase-like enzyme
MPSILHQLGRSVLEELARGLSCGRIQPPYSGLALREWLAGSDQAGVSAELERLRAAGMTPAQIGIVLDLLATERARQQDDHDRIQMVWTGPDQEGPSARDTGVVARELLGQAARSLLITTFSISRDSTTFEPVNEAMIRNKALEVTLVLHVDMSRKSIFGERAASAFARDFWATKWPWPTRPKTFFDPRGIVEHPMGRALQHSKCIVADLERVFITSSNYTESGQLRNIELGVLIRDQRLATRVDTQYRSLIAKKLLLELPM